MNEFITIIKLDSGVASYQVNEQPQEYKASLIKKTTDNDLPQEVVINRKQIHKPEVINDSLTNKLIHAIRNTEENI